MVANDEIIMEVRAIQTYHPTQASVERKEALSVTDLKTHAIAVLSYLLIGVGILIACSSPYIAFTIHPMVAMAAPVVPIALGVKLKTMIQYPLEVHPIDIEGDPHVPKLRGIKNGGANCWMNSALQAVFNLPFFRNELERCSAYSWRVGAVAQAFQQYQADQCHDAKTVSEVDSQKVREWLSKGLGKNSSGQDVLTTNISSQECPMDFIHYFLRQVGHPLPLIKEYQITKETGLDPVMTASKDTRIDLFDLSGFYFAETPPMLSAFNNYFHLEQKTLNGSRTISKRLQSPPEDFFVGLSLAGDDMIKRNKVIDVPMELSFTKKQFGDYASYKCDLFFIHKGDHTNYGHYEAAICLNGRWWLANDSSVTALSTKKAQEMVRTAPFVHYSKADAPPAA